MTERFTSPERPPEGIERELLTPRIEEAIREKQASKPKHSPLPQAWEEGASLTNTPTLQFTYTNWRGVTSIRKVEPIFIWCGRTEWHPDPQWFLKAFDLEKNEMRDFALADIKAFGERSLDTTGGD
ncbi:hypothetical protein SAMN04515647_3700 [Cohaesibacter sp. ES.047]|uniref:WYL domain-containing protein n=1 Tax=Cohaesibacter sp. ES.047 TaxID=1798205 RepID=UPI000BC0212B|nr:hypothetical protein [Cohaesibacter sp. ES.047]SNY93405.1 hypothetical protein SAMN04515647_3700 [Cohaesibacter sp. ES.047]